MHLDNLYIILVDPQMGENIGAAIRVMANFGLINIRIVRPRDGWPNLKAQKAATEHAASVYEGAEIYDELSQAMHDIHYAYAVTARMRDIHKKHQDLNEIFANDFFNHHVNHNIAFIFGSERSGLSNHDVALANTILTIPTNPKCASLNLAQAVGIICYKIYEQSNSKQNTQDSQNNILDQKYATKEEISFMVDHLTAALEHTDFFSNPMMRNKAILNLKNMFMNHTYNSQEISSFRGVIKALERK